MKSIWDIYSEFYAWIDPEESDDDDEDEEDDDCERRPGDGGPGARDGRLGRATRPTGFVRLIDQTRLPTEFVRIDCRDVPAVWEAIRVAPRPRAPAIGIAAAYRRGARGQAALARGRRRSASAPSARPTGSPPHQPADRRQPVLGARPDRPASSRPSRDRRAGRAARPPARRGPTRSPTRTGRCAAPSAATGPSWSRPGRGS